VGMGTKYFTVSFSNAHPCCLVGWVWISILRPYALSQQVFNHGSTHAHMQ